MIVYLQLRTRVMKNWSAAYLCCLSAGVALSKPASLLRGVSLQPSCASPRLDCLQSGWALAFHALCGCFLVRLCGDVWQHYTPDVSVSSGRGNGRPEGRLNQNKNLGAEFWESCFLGPSWQLPAQVYCGCRLRSYIAAFTEIRIIAHTLKIFLTAP